MTSLVNKLKCIKETILILARQASLTRSLSAISLTFIILVTPWSILQVITSVTMQQVYLHATCAQAQALNFYRENINPL